MPFLTRHVISITTATDGSATAYSSAPANGEVYAVRYVPGGSALANTADITITGADSGIPILTITNQAQSSQNYAPRMATHDIAGAALLYAAAGIAVSDRIPLAGELIKAVVAQGGNTLSGSLYVWVG